jgi:hypothetical protein
MTHKEFYIWLDGFMTNREWNTITQSDIETLQEKMKEVVDEKPIQPSIQPLIRTYEQIPVPINPIKDDPYSPPFEVYCGDKQQLND